MSTEPAPVTAIRLAMSDTNRAVTLDGHAVDRVTDILNAIAKPALVQWAADCAADYTIEHFDELREGSRGEAWQSIRMAHRDTMRRARVAGTDVHHYGERLARGETVTPPDELRGFVESYARFLDAWEIEPIAVETPLACTDRFPYAGRADLWATIGKRDHGRALVDLKTGKGVYAETALQLAAYVGADLWQPDGPMSEEPKPPVDLAYVAHIRADGVDMLPVPAALTMQQNRVFRYVQQVSRWIKTHGYGSSQPLIGDPERVA